MRNKIVFSLFGIVALCGIAFADLDPYADYDISDAVWSVTTVNVDSNMGDVPSRQQPCSAYPGTACPHAWQSVAYSEGCLPASQDVLHARRSTSDI